MFKEILVKKLSADEEHCYRMVSRIAKEVDSAEKLHGNHSKFGDHSP